MDAAARQGDVGSAPTTLYDVDAVGPEACIRAGSEPGLDAAAGHVDGEVAGVAACGFSIDSRTLSPGFLTGSGPGLNGAAGHTDGEVAATAAFVHPIDALGALSLRLDAAAGHVDGEVAGSSVTCIKAPARVAVGRREDSKVVLDLDGVVVGISSGELVIDTTGGVGLVVFVANDVAAIGWWVAAFIGCKSNQTGEKNAQQETGAQAAA